MMNTPNEMKITTAEYQQCISGFFAYDCAVRSQKSFSFVLLEAIDDAANGEKRIFNYLSDKPPGRRIGCANYSGFNAPRLATSSVPKNQAVMVSRRCDVAIFGGGDDEFESPISTGPTGALSTSCHGLATIDGHVYATGPWRSVCRRLGPNKWQSIVDRQTMPEPVIDSYGGSSNKGFHAIAGFNANDIYCVGGEGDAWRYDGKRWYQCAVPTNMLFESVCCAGDGYVYIGMQSGSVMRGRENKWKIIHKDEMSLPFRDMVWFDGKVWCTSDYGLWVIEDGKLREAPVPPEVKVCSGNLAVGDGVMLLAGYHGATVHDGKQWNELWLS